MGENTVEAPLVSSDLYLLPSRYLRNPQSSLQWQLQTIGVGGCVCDIFAWKMNCKVGFGPGFRS
jgi:hypothetical protein